MHAPRHGGGQLAADLRTSIQLAEAVAPVKPLWLEFTLNQACDIVQLDIRNTGGLLESKKIADLPMAAHNTGSAINTMATVQWAASVRDFFPVETLIGRLNWIG